MKHLSFKILILCVLLPPVLYVLSVQAMQGYLDGRYENEIHSIYIGDTQPLFDGSVTLENAIDQNIGGYLKSRRALDWGANITVSVTTRQGTILYPAIYDKDDPLVSADPIRVAAANYETLKEGLLLNVELNIDHNTLISNLMLAFYIFLSLALLYGHYRSGSRKARQEDLQKQSEIDRLQQLEKNFSGSITSLAEDRQKLNIELADIRKKLTDEQSKASQNEDAMINEIVSLEERIEKNIALQAEKETEIGTLKETINSLEISRKKTGQRKKKGLDIVQKTLQDPV